MSQTTTHGTLDDFLAATAALGVTRIVLRRTEEHRPAMQGGSAPTEHVRRCELLAYSEGDLQKCVLDGTVAAELAEPLANAGLHVTIVSGNIT